MIDEARENIVESRRDIIRKKKRDGKKLGRKGIEIEIEIKIEIETEVRGR